MTKRRSPRPDGWPLTTQQSVAPWQSVIATIAGVRRLRRQQKGNKTMIDNYYVDLARSELAEAEKRLVSAQKFIRDSGLGDDEIKVTQRIINGIRKQNDYLALLPPNGGR